MERDITPGAGESLFAVTLVEEEGITGLSYQDVAGVDDLSEQDELVCARPGEPFRLAWIAEGRCPLPEVAGARVVLEVW